MQCDGAPIESRVGLPGVHGWLILPGTTRHNIVTSRSAFGHNTFAHARTGRCDGCGIDGDLVTSHSYLLWLVTVSISIDIDFIKQHVRGAKERLDSQQRSPARVLELVRPEKRKRR